MPNEVKEIQAWIGIIGETENRINDQKKETIKQIREIFLELAKIAKEFSEKGNVDEVPDLLKKLESAKEKVNWELQKLLEQSMSHIGEMGEKLQGLVKEATEGVSKKGIEQWHINQVEKFNNKYWNYFESEYWRTSNKTPTKAEEETSVTQGRWVPEQKESFKTTEDENNKKKALNFIQNKINDQNTLELIKKKINEIEYTQRGIKIGNVEWARISASNNLKQANKSDFEQSFKWLFGKDIPNPTENSKWELDYPRDAKIAVIPFLLGWKKNGRYGQDWRWYLRNEAGFYAFQDGRVCKFDETGGTIRPKRAADGKINSTYIVK